MKYVLLSIFTMLFSFMIGCSTVGPVADFSENGTQKVARNLQYVGNAVLETETDASGYIYFRIGLIYNDVITWQSYYNTYLTGLKPKLVMAPNSDVCRVALAYLNNTTGNIIIKYGSLNLGSWVVSWLGQDVTISGDYRNKNFNIDMIDFNCVAIAYDDINYGAPYLAYYRFNSNTNLLERNDIEQIGNIGNSRIISLSLGSGKKYAILIETAGGDNCAIFTGYIVFQNNSYSIVKVNNSGDWLNGRNALSSLKSNKIIATYLNSQNVRLYKVGTLQSDYSITWGTVQNFGDWPLSIPISSFYLDDGRESVLLGYNYTGGSYYYSAPFDGSTITFGNNWDVINTNGGLSYLYF